MSKQPVINHLVWQLIDQSANCRSSRENLGTVPVGLGDISRQNAVRLPRAISQQFSSVRG